MRLPDKRADWHEGSPMDQEFGNLPPDEADFHAFHDLTRFARTVPNRLSELVGPRQGVGSGTAT